MPHNKIVVIGASSGGIQALQELVRALPTDLGVPVLIVQHVGNSSPGLLPDILNRVGGMFALHPKDGEELQPNHIYVATPDHHLTIEDGHVRLLRGPKENRHRPSIDVLFRSAAQFYGPGVIGVVLTGFLDDGTNGLARIKQRGGTAIVQDPDDAVSPGMPQSAIERVEVDYVLPLAEIAPMLVSLVEQAEPKEGAIAMPERSSPPASKPSTFTCPDCSGALWELEEGDALNFRCRVGHAYSADSMFASQADALERALWAATRSLEESAALGRKLAKRAGERSHFTAARTFEDRAAVKEQHANVLRDLLRQDDKHLPREEGTTLPEAKSA